MFQKTICEPQVYPPATDYTSSSSHSSSLERSNSATLGKPCKWVPPSASETSDEWSPSALLPSGRSPSSLCVWSLADCIASSATSPRRAKKSSCESRKHHRFFYLRSDTLRKTGLKRVSLSHSRSEHCPFGYLTFLGNFAKRKTDWMWINLSCFERTSRISLDACCLPAQDILSLNFLASDPPSSRDQPSPTAFTKSRGLSSATGGNCKKNDIKIKHKLHCLRYSVNAPSHQLWEVARR